MWWRYVCSVFFFFCSLICLESNLRLLAMREGEVVASPLFYRQTQKVSWLRPVELAWSPVTWQNNCCNKNSLSILSVCCYIILQLNIIHQEVSIREFALCYRPKAMSKYVVCYWVCSFRSGQINMLDPRIGLIISGQYWFCMFVRQLLNVQTQLNTTFFLITFGQYTVKDCWWIAAAK